MEDLKKVICELCQLKDNDERCPPDKEHDLDSEGQCVDKIPEK